MNRQWIILNWNLRGINSQIRWDAIRLKIEESNCNIICFQETKREDFDHSYIHNFCPRKFNKFAYVPSNGNSGGLLIIWNGALFEGSEVNHEKFQLTVRLRCKLSNETWYLTNIYGPTITEERALFTSWLNNLDTSQMELWMILGDFNLIRSPENRNRAGGDANNMLLFNSIIQNLDLEEIPLKGRAYTWSNMQDNPLLEKLDWIFTSTNWTTQFPNTMAIPLAKLTSDHIPIQIQIGTSIPKANIFRFEEYWLEFDGFMEVVGNSWLLPGINNNPAKELTARLKSVRAGLKKWSRNLSKLHKVIESCSYVLALIDGLEEQRNLSLQEKNFREALRSHQLKLLEAKRIY